MDTARILTELRAERERIDRAITALEALDETGSPKAQRGQQTRSRIAPKPRGLRMTPAARKHLSEMMKIRWAHKKQEAKPNASTKKIAAKQAASNRTKGGITPAGRRRISAMMKKRWAEKKKAAAKA